jgi:hypothetical protein
MSLFNRIKGAIEYRGLTFPTPLEDPSELDWPDRWVAIHYDDVGKFSRELLREMPSDHRLYGLPFCVMGRREDRDDFLFQIQDADYKFAHVHLTWAKESDPQWPWTTLYKTFEDFIAEEESEESEQGGDGDAEEVV